MHEYEFKKETTRKKSIYKLAWCYFRRFSSHPSNCTWTSAWWSETEHTTAVGVHGQLLPHSPRRSLNADRSCPAQCKSQSMGLFLSFDNVFSIERKMWMRGSFLFIHHGSITHIYFTNICGSFRIKTLRLQNCHCLQGLFPRQVISLIATAVKGFSPAHMHTLSRPSLTEQGDGTSVCPAGPGSSARSSLHTCQPHGTGITSCKLAAPLGQQQWRQTTPISRICMCACLFLCNL